MKILCIYTDEDVKKKFQKKFNNNEISFFKGTVQDLKESNFKKFKNIEIITSFISSIFTAEIIDKFPNLKMIATRSTGIDHINLEYCKKKEIEIKNIPDYGSNTVAEYTFALLLAISRKAFATYKKVQKDNSFSRRGMQDIRGFDLSGKTIGVIGAGKIGKNVIKIAHGFNMNILANDCYPDKKFAKELDFKYVIFNELLKKSDIISLHVPATKGTRHLISKGSIEKMKDGVIIINTARGNIIDTKALYTNLKKGKIKAAGLDVLEQEECLGREEKNNTDNCTKEITKINQRLIKMDNVIVTPHNAFNTQEALERIWNKTIENIKNFC